MFDEETIKDFKEGFQAAFNSRAEPDQTDFEASQNSQPRPFDFIRDADPNNLTPLLKQELPQTIAVVLSHLDPHKASVILQNFPTEIQSDVVNRVACMKHIRGEIIREIERVLEKKLSCLSNDFANVGGVEQAMKIRSLVEKERKNTND